MTSQTPEQRLAAKLALARYLLREFIAHIDAKTPPEAFKAAEQTSPKDSLLGKARQFLEE